jgi:tetratricopeptide (TPR) repeat protein
MFVSSDGRTFAEPPAEWNIGTWEDKSTFFGGSPQSLAGDLIRDGVTGIAAHVAEPFLEYTIRPNILFPAYLSGFNLVESYYLAMPALSWQTVVIGDPLCAPFRSKSLASQTIDKGIDPETELPGYFSERRLRMVTTSAVRPGAAKLILKADVRIAKQDLAGAREALEQATAIDSRLGNVQFILAGLYEQAKEYDKAIERYRKVLETSPDHVLALNNLAYSLAVRRNSPKVALPLAERANALAKGNPSIMDTLAWVYHLTGSNDKAMDLLQSAVGLAPQNAEMHLHLAIVCGDIEDRTLQAASELARALELDPNLETSDDVKTLRAKLKRFEIRDSRFEIVLTVSRDADLFQVFDDRGSFNFEFRISNLETCIRDFGLGTIVGGQVGDQAR